MSGLPTDEFNVTLTRRDIGIIAAACLGLTLQLSDLEESPQVEDMLDGLLDIAEKFEATRGL